MHLQAELNKQITNKREDDDGDKIITNGKVLWAATKFRGNNHSLRHPQ